MIDKRIGKRIMERRVQLGLTQAQLAEKIGVKLNYIATVERGDCFPRCERLINLLNALQTTADSIFCDVTKYSVGCRPSVLSEKLKDLSPEAQSRILDIVEFLIQYEQK